MKRTGALLIALALNGCVHQRGAIVSATSLGDQEQPISIGKGRSGSVRILLIGPFGDDSVSSALDHAMANTEADSMINVFADFKTINIPFDFLPIVSISRTDVRGTLIRYKDEIKRPSKIEVPKTVYKKVEEPMDLRSPTRSESGDILVRRVAETPGEIVEMFSSIPKNELVRIVYRGKTITGTVGDKNRSSVWINERGKLFGYASYKVSEITRAELLED